LAAGRKPEFADSIVEPICLASLCRLSWPTDGGKSRLLFANPNNLERRDGKAAPGKGRDRVNLTVRLSYDEAQSWPISKTLEAGAGGYSDLATGADGTIYWSLRNGERREERWSAKPGAGKVQPGSG